MILSLTLLCVALASGRPFKGNDHAGCNSQPPFDRYLSPQNLFPILNTTTARRLVRSIPGGLLYHIVLNADGSDNAPPTTVSEIHVWGTPYEWGLRSASLIGDDLRDIAPRMWEYLKAQVAGALSFLPVWLQNLIATIGLEAALDLTYDATVDYTDPNIYTEMRGLAAGSGVDYVLIRRLNQLAGLTQGACSMFGAWGSATANGGLLQMRALDWAMDAPVRDHSAITVYHPSDPQYGHTHATVGIVGMIGALSGVSSAALGISEIGVAFPDSTYGSESRIGVPFVFVLRAILQYDESLAAATNRLEQAMRTCDLILGVGDGEMQRFNSFAYSASKITIVSDRSLLPANSTWHPQLRDVVYHGMDWECPSFNWMLHRQLALHHGSITPAIAIRDVMAVEGSGSNHVALYDYRAGLAYVSFSAPLNAPSGAKVNAYERQYGVWDMNAMWSEAMP